MNNKEMLKIKYSEEFAEEYSANLDDYKDILPELADFSLNHQDCFSQRNCCASSRLAS